MDRGLQTEILARHSAPKWRLSVAAFHQMVQAGILRKDDRVELLEGQLIAMCPIGPRHAFTTDMLIRLLTRAVASEIWLRVQGPVNLDDITEPNPDVTLVREGWDGGRRQHPGAKDVILLVEVADSSIATDKGAKRELYARAGIPEYWIVDLTRDVVLVHREPRDGAYATVLTRAPSDTLDVAALPGMTIPAGPLFT